MSQKPIKYRFYATLLDAFQNYLDSEKNYSTFYSSDNPSLSCDEYEDKVFKEFIDKLNRVPFSSEAADRGTAFNEVVDCLISNTKSEKCEFTIDETLGNVFAIYKNQQFVFPLKLCREFAEYYQGGISQVFVSGTIETKYGTVELYGYIDELLPFTIHDIKTTKHYQSSKFLHHWQHKVYPYCLSQQGCENWLFEYNVTDFNETFTESYSCEPGKYIPDLIDHCERLIEFLESYRHLITDRKLFNLPDEHTSDTDKE